SDQTEWQNSPNVSLGELDSNKDESDNGKKLTQDSDSDSSETEDEIKNAPAAKSKTDQSISVSESELVKGRLVRKPTRPTTPVAPKRMKLSSPTEPKASTSASQCSAEAKSQFVAPKSKRLRQVKNVSIRCSKQNSGKLSEQSTVVEEDGEVIFENKISRKNQKEDEMIVNLHDIIPEGQVQTSDIELKLKRGAVVELNFKYCPSDN
ncbi:MAG: hypothetical protein N0E59_23265, partial [Candidatus Thiodiazotropha taylori]|nr:hypothetical protein [Candidatus Thiodiazotropha taylori]MCW4286042.1 hypothetical protein [Candidatus Thiodiazotropha taylori]